MNREHGGPGGDSNLAARDEVDAARLRLEPRCDLLRAIDHGDSAINAA